MVKVWQCRVVDERSIQLSAPGVPWVTVLVAARRVDQVALAFDNNMYPFVTFVDDAGSAFFYWFDSLDNSQKLNSIPGAVTPRCCIDDHRESQSAVSDVVLAYIKSGSLCVRYQRERYQTEHILQSGLGPDAQLVSVAMNRAWRLQFRLRRSSAVVGAAVFVEPFLADIVANLYERSGISSDKVDSSRLFDTTVEGFKVANEAGADVMVQALQQAYFFDPSESDRKLRAVPRGGDPVMDIPADALLARDDGPLSTERVQEAELLRKVNVTMLDSSIDYTTNTQSYERRSSTVRAKAESSVEIPITASPDFHASVAKRRMQVAWGENESHEFELPIAYSALVPGDVVNLRDKPGRGYRMRLMDIQEDGGHLAVEASADAPWAYDATAKGVQAAPPTSTTPGLAGETVVVILDIPVQRDQDDELGYYIGAIGTGGGWQGAEIQMSTDGGASVGQVLQVTAPTAIGVTMNALQGEVSAEYSSQQTLTVAVPEPLESVDYATLLRYTNKAAVRHGDGSWELLQFQTAIQAAPGVFELSGLVRGRYATPVGPVPMGATFVVIDTALTFVQVQQWMTGTTISYRGVSYGQDEDAVGWASFAVEHPRSQTEWPVHSVRAVRSGSDVAVSWIGRARLGVETAPRQSKYFAGYRVIYSDGYTADTAATQHSRSGVPAGATVRVVALNAITGPGPASEVVTT